MKLIITKISTFSVFAVVLTLFSMSVFAGPYEDGFNAGKATCQICQTCPPDWYQDGFNAGKATCQICQTCPPDRYQDGFNAGKATCQICPTCPSQRTCPTCPVCPPQRTCPTCPVCPPQQTCPTCSVCPRPVCPDCQIDYQLGHNVGRKECQLTPISCGIMPYDPNAITEAGKEVGKQECQHNPYSCFQAAAFTDFIPETFCNNNIKNCVSILHGKLYLPAVNVVLDLNDVENTIYKDVKMDMLVGESNVLFVMLEGRAVETTKLTIKIEGKGEGEVISYPMGIICGRDCTETYEIGILVELFAVPVDSNSIFSRWSGDCQGTTNHITLQIDMAKTCKAIFVEK